jgi:hypothetical protein
MDILLTQNSMSYAPVDNHSMKSGNNLIGEWAGVTTMQDPVSDKKKKPTKIWSTMSGSYIGG